MNFVQVAKGSGLGHEHPHALIERSFDEQIGSSAFGPTSVVERRPFAKSSRRIEINVSLGRVAGHFFTASAFASEPMEYLVSRHGRGLLRHCALAALLWSQRSYPTTLIPAGTDLPQATKEGLRRRSPISPSPSAPARPGGWMASERKVLSSSFAAEASP